MADSRSGWRDVLQTGGGVAHDRQQAVEEKAAMAVRDADSEKRQRDEQREEGERRNGLHRAGQAKNDMADRAAPAGDNSKWHADDDGEKQRKAGEFEMSRRPAEKFVRERFAREYRFCAVRKYNAAARA